MAAPRRYSDSQRAAMFALYEQGYTPAEIARRCAEGTASASPFQVPRRSVHNIVTAMARERKLAPPRKLEDVLGDDAAELVDRFPKRVAALVGAELEKAESKARSGQRLPPQEFARMEAASKLMASIRRRFPQRMPTTQPASSNGRRSTSRSTSKEEGLIERLRRDELEHASSEGRADAGWRKF